MKTHSSEKSHKCKYCDKTFSNSSNLNRHKKTHSSEKSHNWKYCDKAFSDISNLTRHLQTYWREPLSVQRLWQNICREKNRIINSADFVARSLLRLLIFQNICLDILKRNLLSVVNVIKLLQGRITLKNIFRHTLEKNLISVLNVIKLFLQVINFLDTCSHTIGSTL